MDPPIPALVTTREEALTLMDRYFETLDPGVFAAMVRATTDAEDAAVFGIVRGSENEMDLLNKAMYLLRERAITPLLNSLAFIAREKAIRTAKAA